MAHGSEELRGNAPGAMAGQAGDEPDPLVPCEQSAGRPDVSGAGSWKEALTWAFRSKRVVTPNGVRPATLLVRSGKIHKIVAWEDVPPDAHLNDYGDLVLLPGLVDTHVHINDAESSGAELTDPSRKHWEGFTTATRAAAAGGVTTLVDMPLNCTPETTSLPALEAKRCAGANAWVDWMTWGGIVGNNGVGGNEAELPALVRAGITGFKCFLVHSGIKTFAWVDEPQLSRAMAVLRSAEFSPLELPLLAHAELAAPVERATAFLDSQSGGADWRSYSTYLASPSGRSRGRSHRIAHRARCHLQGSNPRSSSLERPRAAAAQESSIGGSENHRGNLPPLPLVCRGRYHRRCNRIQMRSAHSKRSQPRATLASARGWVDRSDRHRSLPLPSRTQTSGNRPLRPGLGRNREPWFIAPGNLDRHPPPGYRFFADGVRVNLGNPNGFCRT